MMISVLRMKMIFQRQTFLKPHTLVVEGNLIALASTRRWSSHVHTFYVKSSSLALLAVFKTGSTIALILSCQRH
jgi:hypothetical protein